MGIVVPIFFSIRKEKGPTATDDLVIYIQSSHMIR